MGKWWARISVEMNPIKEGTEGWDIGTCFNLNFEDTPIILFSLTCILKFFHDWKKQKWTENYWIENTYPENYATFYVVSVEKLKTADSPIILCPSLQLLESFGICLRTF